MQNSHDWYKHQITKETSRKNRKNKRKYKEKNKIKTMRYQKTCDKYKKALKKKGKGRMVKTKGKTLLTPIAANDKIVKSWTRIGYGKNKPLKEGLKLYAIYAIT